MDIDIEEDKVEITTKDIKISLKGRIQEKWVFVVISLIVSIFGFGEYYNP
tara:strand:- start:881 stop:1030 length:150 start_codon:yes stop_codon:yes gene_type:complete